MVRCHVMCPYQSAVNRAVKMCHYMLRLRAEILTFIFLFMVFNFFKLTMFGINRPSVPTSNLIFFFRNLSAEVICKWCPSLIGCGFKGFSQSESRERFQYLHAQWMVPAPNGNKITILKKTCIYTTQNSSELTTLWHCLVW